MLCGFLVFESKVPQPGMVVGEPVEEVKNNLEMRDYIDSNRKVSPLRKAKDAIELNNTNLTEEEQFARALGWAKNKIS